MAVRTATFVCVLSVAAVGAGAAPPTDALEFCKYETVFIPCSKLARPIIVGSVRISYRPLKAIPIWPNNSIFGGYDDIAEKQYNRVVQLTAVPKDRDIRLIEFADYASSEFVERFFTAGKYRVMIKTSDVFRGPEVFALWVTSLTN